VPRSRQNSQANPNLLTPGQEGGQQPYRRQDTISGLEYFPFWAAKEKPPLTVVGDVSGHIAIMVVSWYFFLWQTVFLCLARRVADMRYLGL
jgi:hypothetical protein